MTLKYEVYVSWKRAEHKVTETALNFFGIFRRAVLILTIGNYRDGSVWKGNANIVRFCAFFCWALFSFYGFLIINQMQMIFFVTKIRFSFIFHFCLKSSIVVYPFLHRSWRSYFSRRISNTFHSPRSISISCDLKQWFPEVAYPSGQSLLSAVPLKLAT